jgi:hypothetical protein
MKEKKTKALGFSSSLQRVKKIPVVTFKRSFAWMRDTYSVN